MLFERFVEKLNDTNANLFIYLYRAKEMHAIQMVKTTTRYHGWIQMNFTSKLNEWITKKESNNLLYITVEYENELGNWETPNISTNKLLSYSDNEKQPFITAYFANDESYGHVLARKPVKKMTTVCTYLILIL